MSRANKYTDVRVLDDIPRYVGFKCEMRTPESDVKGPGSVVLTLPYQALPNGRILATQLIKAELHYSPVLIQADSTDNNWVTQRTMFAVGPYASSGKPWRPAYPDPAISPYTCPEVIGVHERQFHARPTGAATNASANIVQIEPMATIHFGCGKAKPVLTGPNIAVLGWHLCSYVNNTAETMGSAFAAPMTSGGAFTGPTDEFVYCNVMPGGTLPDPEAPESNTQPAYLPFVQGRLWFHIVELTPRQHLAVGLKFGDRAGNTAPTIFDQTGIDFDTKMPYFYTTAPTQTTVTEWIPGN